MGHSIPTLPALDEHRAGERKVWRVVHVPAVTDEDRATNNEAEKNQMWLDCQPHRRLLTKASNMNRLLSLGAALTIVLGAVSLCCNSEHPPEVSASPPQV